MTEDCSRPVWLEINLENIKYNIQQIIEQLSAATKLMAVVKANAYGHGFIPVAAAVINAGAHRLGVALPEEGKQLRKAGFKLPIHVLGEVLPSQIPALIDFELIPTVSKIDSAQRLNQLAGEKNIIKKVHIKIDTGMGRIGVYPEAAVDFIKQINRFKNIEIEGLMTHFARADEKDKEYTFQQWEKFNYIIRKLKEVNIHIPIKHAANSAAVMDLPQMELNLVRPGIMIYGLRPSAEVKENVNLKPALSWKTRIIYLKDVNSGEGISYGTTFITKRKTKIATIPMGYADGYPRLLSNKAQVLVHGSRVPVRGNICMDQFMIDVTDIPEVKVGDEVVIIGTQGEEKITAAEIAHLCNTINYEITTCISQRVPRIYI